MVLHTRNFSQFPLSTQGPPTTASSLTMAIHTVRCLSHTSFSCQHHARSSCAWSHRTSASYPHRQKAHVDLHSVISTQKSNHTARHAERSKPTVALQSQQTMSDPQLDQPHTDAVSFTPLTKAPKMVQTAPAAFPLSRLQQARKAAGYAALAVGAGFAMTALAVDVTDAALASAVLAAGAAVLSAAGVGANRQVRRSEKGGAAPLLGALALRLNAAQILSFAVGPQASPGSPGKTPKSGAQNTATAAESSLAVQMAADVLDSEWEDEEDDIMGQYSDAEWARRAKIIESEPCQVWLDDALLFAQQFDSCHVLPGQANYPEQSPQLVQPASKALLERGRGASQVRRKEKLKQKKQKKKRNRRK